MIDEELLEIIKTNTDEPNEIIKRFKFFHNHELFNKNNVNWYYYSDGIKVLNDYILNKNYSVVLNRFDKREKFLFINLINGVIYGK